MPHCEFCKQDVPVNCTFSGTAEYCHRMKPGSTEANNVIAAVEAVLTPAATFADGVPIPTKPAVDKWDALREYAETDPPVKPSFTEDDAVALLRKATTQPINPMKVQIGGNHYSKMPIQPITFIQANKLGWEEGNVVKYVSRWQDKNGVEDLKKARDILDKKIAFEEAQAKSGLMEYLSALFKSV